MFFGEELLKCLKTSFEPLSHYHCYVKWLINTSCLLWITFQEVVLLLKIAFHRYKKLCRPLSLPWAKHKSQIVVIVAGCISCVLAVPIFYLVWRKKRENITFQEYNATIHTWNVSNFMSVMSFSYMIFCTIMFTLISPTIIILYTLIGMKIFQKFSESSVSNRAKDHAINNVENKMNLPEVIYTK